MNESSEKSEKPLRVTWLHSHFNHFHSGGTQFVLNFADHLQRFHHCRVSFHVDAAGPDAHRFCAEHGLALTEIDRASTNSAWFWLTLRSRVRQKRKALASAFRDADVVVSSMFPMNLLADPSACPHVQICFEPFAFFHDEACLSALPLHHRLFFRVMAQLYADADREALRRADRVVTVNQSGVPRFRELFGVEPSVVYLGYDSAFWRRPAPSVCDAWRRRHGGGPLLFHSTDLSGIKGTTGLLDVMEVLARDEPSLRLLVTIYVDDPAGARRLESEISARRLSDNVVLLGRIPRDDLPRVYGAVDLVVQPGSQPANGTLREALLCETPIVGGVSSEEVVEGRNGIKVDVRRPAEAARAIRSLLEGRSRLDVTSAGRDFIASQFPFARSVASFHELLREAIGGHRAGRRGG